LSRSGSIEVSKVYVPGVINNRRCLHSALKMRMMLKLREVSKCLLADCFKYNGPYLIEPSFVGLSIPSAKLVFALPTLYCLEFD
jgi:hypothetical protein